MTASSQIDIEKDLAFAIEIARDAGQRALGLRLEKAKKGDGPRWEGPTLADVGDQACDGLLQGYLRGRYPDDGILSEETADSPERLRKERVWIVDPLDGTKEYCQRRDDWAVHVALTLNGRCALAAVALPSIDEVIWGVCIEGQERAGAVNGLALSSGTSAVQEVPKIVVSRSHTPPWVESFAQAMKLELFPCGSVGFKASRLLTGEADAYVHKIGLKEWDTCAPETVARALGWHVSKLAGDEHVYNLPDPHNHELVMCRPEWKERVLEAVKAAGALEA